MPFTAATGAAGDDTQPHYAAAAAAYEEAFFYRAGPYQDWLLSTVLDTLRLSPEHVLVDVGGGTGSFTAELAAKAGLQHPCLCVDNSADMLRLASSRPGVVPLLSDALSFSRRRPAPGELLDRLLLKEVVHHVPLDDIAALYRGLAEQLSQGGLVLTVTRPQEVGYPLWPAARDVWRANQPAATEYLSAMEAAGLEVSAASAFYDAEVPKKLWLDMVRARFWSTFSAEHFTDAQLAEGLAELEEEFKGRETVDFREELLMLVGKRR